MTFTVGRECFLTEGIDPEDVDETDKGILERLREWLGLGDLNFRSRRGLYGYDIGWDNGGIVLCWGGCDTIMVQMSGTGCRLYETVNKDLEWMALISQVLSYSQRHFSRLDIACDTFGVLDMSKLMEYTRAHRYVSRFADWEVRQGNKIRQVIFGSPTSRMLLRIYDKTLERTRAIGSAENVPPDWIRLEFQLRNEAAESFINAWQNTGNLSTAYFGIMANQLRFVKERDVNATRSTMTAWWRKFLGNADKIKLAYRGGLEYNLQSLQRYIFGQAGSSLKTWFAAHGYDWKEFMELCDHNDLNETQQKRKQELQRIMQTFIDTISFKTLNERQKNLLETRAIKP